MQMIIAVGPSGCGKSHFYNHVLKSQGFIECSADHFFEGPDGYHFDPGLLGAAHAHSRREALSAISKGLKVYISNTNTRAWEREPYIEMAKAGGYTVWLKVFDSDPKICAARNTHGVPPEAVRKMHERIDVPEGYYQIF